MSMHRSVGPGLESSVLQLAAVQLQCGGVGCSCLSVCESEATVCAHTFVEGW